MERSEARFLNDVTGHFHEFSVHESVKLVHTCNQALLLRQVGFEPKCVRYKAFTPHIAISVGTASGAPIISQGNTLNRNGAQPAALFGRCRAPR